MSIRSCCNFPIEILWFYVGNSASAGCTIHTRCTRKFASFDIDANRSFFFSVTLLSAHGHITHSDGGGSSALGQLLHGEVHTNM